MFVCTVGIAGEPLTLRSSVEAVVTLDGRLDEAEWSHAIDIGQLLQVSPVAGASASVRTRVRILRDDDTLYFGILASQGEGFERTVRQTARDADLTGDDHIALVMDPAGAGRNGYVFRKPSHGGEIYL